MPCIVCGNEINEPSEGCELPSTYTRKHLPDRHSQRIVGFWHDPAHLDCVEHPADMGDAAYREWASKMLLRERNGRESLERKMESELEIIHRALHALPPEMISGYIAELYDSDGEARSESNDNG